MWSSKFRGRDSSWIVRKNGNCTGASEKVSMGRGWVLGVFLRTREEREESETRGEKPKRYTGAAESAISTQLYTTTEETILAALRPVSEWSHWESASTNQNVTLGIPLLVCSSFPSANITLSHTDNINRSSTAPTIVCTLYLCTQVHTLEFKRL